MPDEDRGLPDVPPRKQPPGTRLRDAVLQAARPRDVAGAGGESCSLRTSVVS